MTEIKMFNPQLSFTVNAPGTRINVDNKKY